MPKSFGSRKLPKSSRAEMMVEATIGTALIRMRQDRRLRTMFNDMSDDQRTAFNVILGRSVREAMNGVGYYKDDDHDATVLRPGFVLASVYAHPELFTVIYNAVRPGVDPDDLWKKLLQEAQPGPKP